MDYKVVVDIGVNPPILLLNSKVAITHFESDTRQMFETDEGSFIYFKDEQKLHKVTQESYVNALIRVITFVDYKVNEDKKKSYDS